VFFLDLYFYILGVLANVGRPKPEFFLLGWLRLHYFLKALLQLTQWLWISHVVVDQSHNFVVVQQILLPNCRCPSSFFSCAVWMFNFTFTESH